MSTLLELLELPDLIDLRARSEQRTFTTDPKTHEHLFGVYETVRHRPWSAVHGITLHQTACNMGEDPKRYLNTGAHYVVTRSGKQIQLHDETDRIVHGNDWNAQCVGVECDGLYAGVEGWPATVWNDPSTKWRELAMTVTDELVAAATEVCRRIKRNIEAHGGTLRVIVSHRQSSESRQSDPGETIWKRVALPLMAEWGIDDGGPGFKIGDGRPNPEAWDPTRVGIKY